MEKYAVPNKLPSKQVTVLTHRKKRITQQQQTLKKKPQRKIINANSGEHFKKPEFFVAEYRKAERDDKRIKRELMKHGLQRKHMKDGELVVVLRHRGKIFIFLLIVRDLHPSGFRNTHCIRTVHKPLEPDRLAKNASSCFPQIHCGC